MESTELADLLDKIQFKTRKSLEEIAADIGYSRPYLNSVKFMTGQKTDKVIGMLHEKYGSILQNRTPADNVDAGVITKEVFTLMDKEKLIQALLKLIDNNGESIAAYKILAQSNLNLSQRINSDALLPISPSLTPSGTVSTNPVEKIGSSGKQDKSSGVLRRQRKDSVKH